MNTAPDARKDCNGSLSFRVFWNSLQSLNDGEIWRQCTVHKSRRATRPAQRTGRNTLGNTIIAAIICRHYKRRKAQESWCLGTYKLYLRFPEEDGNTKWKTELLSSSAEYFSAAEYFSSAWNEAAGTKWSSWNEMKQMEWNEADRMKWSSWNGMKQMEWNEAARAGQIVDGTGQIVDGTGWNRCWLGNRTNVDWGKDKWDVSR